MELSNKLTYLQRNENGKILISNFIYLFLLQIASYIFPLLTLPYLAKTIGAEGFGKIAFAAAVIIWVQTITDWGFNYTATRDVAKNRDNKQLVSLLFSRVLWARCLLMVLSLIFLSLFVYFIPVFRTNAAIIFISFLLIPGHILFPDWFFQALEQMKYITIFNLISKLIFTLAVFIFIKGKEQYLLQPLFISLGYVISGIIAIYYITAKWGYKIYKPDFNSIIQTIKESTDVFLNNITPNLYNSFSTILLGFWGGNIANGKFDAGNKMVVITQQFIQLISRVFFPFLARNTNKFQLFEQLNLVIGLLASFLLLISAPAFIHVFFTSEFHDAIYIMQILSVSIFFLIISNTYGTNYLIIINKEKELRNTTIICSVIGCILSFPLIYYFSMYGAALTITITRGLLGGAIMHQAKKLMKEQSCKNINNN